MRLLKRVPAINVMRSFAMTEALREKGIAGRRDYKIPTQKQYIRAFTKAKRVVLKSSIRKLEKVRDLSWKKRLNAYKTYKWYTGIVSVNEVGVWKGAGGLPIAWTRGSLAETAKLVNQALTRKSKKIRARSRRAIPAIVSNLDVISKDKLSLPIIFKSGTGTNGRKSLTKMKGDIDDGCMRSIALAVNGAKTLRAYIGIPPKNS